MKKEIEEKIKRHWDDPDFDKIRLMFKDYLVGEGAFDDDYLNAIAHLLGISMEHSDDGYDLWWAMDDPCYIKFIKF